MRDRPGQKVQDIGKQVAVNAKDRARIVKMDAEPGDDPCCSHVLLLSGDLVQLERRGHLHQSQERDPAPDVHRAHVARGELQLHRVLADVSTTRWVRCSCSSSSPSPPPKPPSAWPILLVLFRERAASTSKTSTRGGAEPWKDAAHHRRGAFDRSDHAGLLGKKIGRAATHCVTIVRIAIAFVLSVVVLQGLLDGAPDTTARSTLAGQRRHLDRGRLPGRPPHRPDDGRRHLHLADRAHLHHRLHARRPALHPVLQLHLAVHLRRC